MRVKCDFCDNAASGSIDSLIDLGWQRAVIRRPIRRTVTCCPEHSEEGKMELYKIIGEGMAT